jgi:hypothetical protein
MVLEAWQLFVATKLGKGMDISDLEAPRDVNDCMDGMHLSWRNAILPELIRLTRRDWIPDKECDSAVMLRVHGAEESRKISDLAVNWKSTDGKLTADTIMRPVSFCAVAQTPVPNPAPGEPVAICLFAEATIYMVVP